MFLPHLTEVGWGTSICSPPSAVSFELAMFLCPKAPKHRASHGLCFPFSDIN
jgi:hypothetical protein